MSSSLSNAQVDDNLVTANNDEEFSPEYKARYFERFWSFCLEALDSMARDPENLAAKYWNSQDEEGKQFIKDYTEKHLRVWPHFESVSDDRMFICAATSVLRVIRLFTHPCPRKRDSPKKIREKQTGKEVATKSGKPKRGPNPLLERAILKSASIKMEDFRKCEV